MAAASSRRATRGCARAALRNGASRAARFTSASRGDCVSRSWAARRLVARGVHGRLVHPSVFVAQQRQHLPVVRGSPGVASRPSAVHADMRIAQSAAKRAGSSAAPATGFPRNASIPSPSAAIALAHHRSLAVMDDKSAITDSSSRRATLHKPLKSLRALPSQCPEATVTAWNRS